MIFEETKLKGVFIVKPELIRDNRGFFARTWCAKEFADHGLNPVVVQCSTSFNPTKGTIRGMHYQSHPFEEDKLVRCTVGAIYDVALNIETMQWVGIVLTEANEWELYIPKGYAHGYKTLVDDTEVFYQMSEYYHPEASREICSSVISWPVEGESHVTNN
jgi:dTDP-4-dehydrorhamnose 3,5-epimerase